MQTSFLVRSVVGEGSPSASWTRGVLMLGVVLLMSLTAKADQTREYEFDIPQQGVETALNTMATQADALLLFPYDLVQPVDSKPVSGRYTVEDALAILLEGTGLTGGLTEGGVITISRAGAIDNQGRTAMAQNHDNLDGNKAPTKRRGLLGMLAVVFSAGVGAQDVADVDEEELRIEEIVVTGTNIRGIAPDSSPTRSFDHDDIELTGAATAQDFIQTLPQNFGGSSNPDIVGGGLPSGEGVGFNTSFGASANLRGLGQGSTLVLLNGRRVAPSSAVGDFVDISMIPVAAIDRVDVLLDGASSIYGADAVAGVVNFVLRDDYDGVEGSVRYGTATEGDLDEYKVSGLAGNTWSTGNALISYEFLSQGALSAADRFFSQGAMLPQDLMPSQKRHSAFASIRQDLSTTLEAFADILYSNRRAELNSFDAASTFVFQEPESQTWNATLGGDWNFASDWSTNFYGSYSEVSNTVNLSGDVTSETKVDSKVWTAFVNTSGTVFSLPGGQVKAAIGGEFRSESFDNILVTADFSDRAADRDIYEAFAEVFIPIIGPDNAFPGVYRFEINASGRFSDFSDFGSTTNPKVGVLWAPVENLRFRGSYGTSYKPPALGYVGANDKRVFVYNTALINGILGLSPADPSIADVVAITVNGTADDLVAEESTAFTGGFDFYQNWGPHTLTLSLGYFDIEYENRLGQTPIPDNRSSFDAPNIAFETPSAFPPGTVIFSPTTDQVSDAISDLVAPFGSLPAGLDPFDAEIIRYNAVVRNLGLTFTEGFDFNIGYQYDVGAGVISLGLDGIILTEYAKQASIANSAIDLLDTQFNPLDLKLRGSAGFSNDHVSANVFVNYADGYRVDNTLGGAAIDSWTTVDLSLAYNTSKNGTGVLNDASFRFSVQNLFDENPPVTPGAPTLQIFGYDPANASPLNRFISFEVTKRF